MIRDVEVREKPRVILACLKNANGNLEKLQAELANAAGYWREIIGEATRRRCSGSSVCRRMKRSA
jgi:transposase-like protein